MLFLLLAGLLACSAGVTNAGYVSPMDAVNKLKLKTFGQLIAKAGMAPQLSNRTRVMTLFAPNDAAFSSLFKALDITKPQLLANKDLVTAIVRYHLVLDRKVRTSMLLPWPGQAVPTALVGQGVTVRKAPRAAGRPGAMDFIVEGYAAANVAKFVKQDLNAGKSTVHVIDTALIPDIWGRVLPARPPPPPSPPSSARSIYDYVASQPTLSTLKQAIDSTGMSATLKQTNSGYTLLAPHNGAFEKFMPAPANAPALPVLLGQHLIRGTVFTSQFNQGAQYNTYSDNTVTVVIINANPPRYQLTTPHAKANITIANIAAGSDALHVIDAVLWG